MKKQWENAAIDEVMIQETAGGPIYNSTQDGTEWWNSEQNRWEIPVGQDEILS